MANIYIDRNGSGAVKLLTSGTAMSVLNQRDYTVNSEVWPSWITPEICDERVDVDLAAKDDVWALGTLAYDLFSKGDDDQKTPFSSLQ